MRRGRKGSSAIPVDSLHPDCEQLESAHLQAQEDAQQRTRHVVGTQ